MRWVRTMRRQCVCARPVPVHFIQKRPHRTRCCAGTAGKSRVMVTRYSEGYGTEEDGVLSEPQRDSDADADIEDTDCRLQEPGTLQRISSRRRKRPQVARQDTTESEDDGGRSHKSHRWNLRLSPDRSHSRTILEESVSQVRPLVISQPNADGQKSREEETGSSKLRRLWSSALSAPLILLLSLSVLILIVFFLLPWTRA
ncbi:hypothetical protein OJAV_G00179570 [Oryzias javanicus]|uniref:Uncharacterized protein n=1 Tax=Oryzias javanicus TaxID=123683 RepID=A0A3S2NVH2_ORYJA|nr:hypothetical protein OJAV_G00179570 [Oryzias javanicus]